MPANRSEFVHFGSHVVGPEHWRNFDASPTLRLQRLPFVGPLVRRNLPPGRPLFPETVEFGDVVKGLPVEPDSCRAIYCSHVLEHLAFEECRTALANTFSYLQPGGRFRLVIPDLRGLAEAYLALEDPQAAHCFMERAYLGKRTRPSGVIDRAAGVVGNADHLWMWDYPAMNNELTRHGFVDIRRATYGDSKEPRFGEVEDPTRWEEPGFEVGQIIPCLGIECRKPKA